MDTLYLFEEFSWFIVSSKNGCFGLIFHVIQRGQNRADTKTWGSQGETSGRRCCHGIARGSGSLCDITKGTTVVAHIVCEDSVIQVIVILGRLSWGNCFVFVFSSRQCFTSHLESLSSSKNMYILAGDSHLFNHQGGAKNLDLVLTGLYKYLSLIFK